jgi:hypothetical protein
MEAAYSSVLANLVAIPKDDPVAFTFFTGYMAMFAATISFAVLLIAVSIIAAVFIGTFLPIFLMGPKMMQSGI